MNNIQYIDELIKKIKKEQSKKEVYIKAMAILDNPDMSKERKQIANRALGLIGR